MALHPSILAWKILWAQELGSRLQSMGPQRVGHNCATEHTHMCKHTHTHTVTVSSTCNSELPGLATHWLGNGKPDMTNM